MRITEEVRNWAVRNGDKLEHVNELHCLLDDVDSEYDREVMRYNRAERLWSALVDHYEQSCVKLPRDMDGAIIHFGDWVTDGHSSGRVEGVHLYEDGAAHVSTDNPEVSYKAEDLMHVEQDQLKELLRDCVMKSMGVKGVLDGVPVLEVTDIFDEWYEEFADKVREAAKED